MVKIKVKPNTFIPGYVMRQAPFAFDPMTFGVENERLQERIVGSEVQFKSLEKFTEDPMLPLIYCVTGSPSDAKALYFAAYLASIHYKANKFAKVGWCSLYGGFKNDPLESGSQYSLLVITNLAVNSTNSKFEKARDLLIHYSSIPRIVVAAGEDPLSFMSTKLYMPVHAMAYFSENLLRTRVEVI